MVQVFEADKNVLQGFFYITNVSKALAVEKHLLGEESQNYQRQQQQQQQQQLELPHQFRRHLKMILLPVRIAFRTRYDKRDYFTVGNSAT